MHWRLLTPAQQEMLITRYPRGPRAQTRFLLDHYEIRPDVLASLFGMRRWTVRRLARGWAIPLGYVRREQMRSRVLRLICPLCQGEDQAEREREAVREKARDIRRKARRAPRTSARRP
ncbi:hypothetical protein [Streptomyces sp. NBC_00892]|uniref:hypothetical protein n=1 Tax=Streptomyces sp. NBC_00892 TaxID=2975861 RepID=UPI00225C0677|nr:hypothetical protein [Streptomyces sp. NBC_00892]MCX4902528.1 hypothetical protein [Streptomyces sp. NBC_00892]